MFCFEILLLVKRKETDKQLLFSLVYRWCLRHHTFIDCLFSDVKIVFFFHVNIYSMSTRQDLTPIPYLAEYAFGERLGAGSYGKDLFNQSSFSCFEF